MSTDYRKIAAEQAARAAAGYAAQRVRDGVSSKPLERPPQPERPALTAAEQLLNRADLDPGQEIGPDGTVIELPFAVPGDLFGRIEDREDAKPVLIGALRSKEPVHVLMVGPAATGKSQLLQAIAKLPRSRYAVGGATTSAGLLDYLLDQPGTRNLVIDELDKAETADLYALYSLMESGIVTRLQHDDQVHRIHKVWVFAAANSADKIPDALLSRFVRLDLRPYTPEQLRHINRVILEREGISPARAAEIAEAAASRSPDPRAARDLGRLVGETEPIGDMVDRVIPRAKPPR